MSNPRSLPEKIGCSTALLTDEDIRAAHQQKYIFSSEADFNADRVRQASYELTLLEARALRFEELQNVELPTDAIALEVPAFNVRGGENPHVIINPWQCCLLMVREQFALPDNVVGHIFARGQLFQSGLVVESTYVDPGFSPAEGKSVHLMAFNATQRQIKLPIGVAIARLELIRLERMVSNPHGGRANIKSPEMSRLASPWPTSLKDHGEEIAAARTLRDKDVRLLAMDRVTIAMESLGTKLQSKDHSDAWRRIYMFVTGPLILWLTLRAINLDAFLNADGKAVYDKFYNLLPTWAPFAAIGIAWGFFGIYFNKDVKTALGLKT